MFPPSLQPRSHLARKNFRAGWADALVDSGRDQEPFGWARLAEVLLQRSGFHLTPRLRFRIYTCTDVELLKAWTLQALTAETTAELTAFDER